MSNIQFDIQLVPQSVIEIPVIYENRDPQVGQAHQYIPPALVQSLCVRLKVMRKGKYLMFPVKKLNNIIVEVTLHKERKSSYIFNIGPTEFSVAEDSPNDLNNEPNMIEEISYGGKHRRISRRRQIRKKYTKKIIPSNSIHSHEG